MIMKKTCVKLIIVLLLVMCGLSGAYAAVGKLRLVWTEDPATTVTIAWDQLGGTNPVVYFDTIDHHTEVSLYPFQQGVTASNTKYGMHTMFAKLSGLKPFTNYYFLIKDSEGNSQRYWFRTAPDTPRDFTFISGGDSKSTGSQLMATRASNRLVAKLRPLFVLFNGDFCENMGTTPAYWQQWLDDWFHQTTSSDGRMYPVIPVHGNHENGDFANLTYIFNTPYQYNDNRRIYYSVSIGGELLHILVLNTEFQDTDTTGNETAKQLEWIKEDLEANKGNIFKMTAYHVPMLNAHWEWVGVTDLAKKWLPVFHQYGVNISFEADAHVSRITRPLKMENNTYNIDNEEGIIYVGQGTWGAEPREPSNNPEEWLLTQESYQQFKWIHISPSRGGHLKIYTVITENSGNVEPLSEENLFDLPNNIRLQTIPQWGNYVPCPINEVYSLSADFTSTAQACDSVVAFTNTSSDDATSYFWDFGDGITSTEENPSHTYVNPGIYSVMLTIKDGVDSGTKTKEVSVSFAPVPIDVTGINNGYGTVILSAEGTGTINWYDVETGGEMIGTGENLIASLTTTGAFYAENVIGGQDSGTGGNIDKGIGNYYKWEDDEAKWGVQFDVKTDMVLNSVKVYNGESENGSYNGDRLIVVMNGDGDTIASAIVEVEQGEQRLSLNMPIPAGTNYRLLSDAHVGFWRTTEGATFPYEVGDIVSITADCRFDGLTNTDGYHFFYDWEVEVDLPYCTSARVLAADFSAIDDAVVKNIKIFPNPASSVLNIIDLPLAGGNLTLDMFNNQMQRVKSVNSRGQSSAQIDLKGLASGIYFLKISNGGKLLLVRKVVIETKNQK